MYVSATVYVCICYSIYMHLLQYIITSATVYTCKYICYGIYVYIYGYATVRIYIWCLISIYASATTYKYICYMYKRGGVYLWDRLWGRDGARLVVSMFARVTAW